MPESVSELPLVTQTTPRSSNKKALKTAGLTLLACVLIVGQAFTAYMVVGQRSQMQDLDMRMTRLKEISSRRPMVSGPTMKMRLPMAAMPLLKLPETSADKKEAAKGESRPLTLCEKQSMGIVATQVHSFRPQCDLTGSFVPRQCWMGICWCVKADGTAIPDTLNSESCSAGNTKVQAFAAPAMQLQPLVAKVSETKDN